MDDLHAGVQQEETVHRDVLAVALEHQLVSKYTSLVVADASPARPATEGLVSASLKGNLPDGMQAGVLAGVPRTGTVAELCMVLGAMSLLLSNLLFFLLLRLRMKEKNK